MNPLVSLHIISYNQRDFIGEALASALEQDYENLEVVISDDGSTDGTAEIIQSFARRYPSRMKAIVGGPRLGITGNSNRALAQCRGTYIAFQGGDDILLPGKIRTQVEWLEADADRVLCTHDVDVFESSSGKMLYRWNDIYKLRNGRGLRDILRFGHPCIGPGTAIMIRASCIPSAGFDERLKTASDTKFFYDCLAAGGKFGFLSGVYARYRQHQQNVQRTGRQQLIDDGNTLIVLLETEYPQYAEQFHRVKQLHFHSLAVWSIRDRASVNARRYIREAVRYKPEAALRYLLLYLYTLLPEPLPAMLMDSSSKALKAFRVLVSRVLR